MLNENTTNISLINLPELPDSVDNALQNLTDAPSKNAGQTFGDLWFLVFGGITQAANKKRLKYARDLEVYNQELTSAIEQIPADNKIEPSIQTTAQALENSKYCISEPELRKMFVNLISNSMDGRVSDAVHPSFPEIIKQMSPVDAKIISTFKQKSNQPIENYNLSTLSTTRPLEKYIFFDTNGTHSYLYATSISSLERLGLLSVDFMNKLTDSSSYNVFSKWAYYEHLKKQFENDNSDDYIEIEQGVCSLTPLGQIFVSVCVS